MYSTTLNNHNHPASEELCSHLFVGQGNSDSKGLNHQSSHSASKYQARVQTLSFLTSKSIQLPLLSINYSYSIYEMLYKYDKGLSVRVSVISLLLYKEKYENVPSSNH